MFIKETFLICDYCGENYGADNRVEGLSAKQLRSKKSWFHYIKGKDVCDRCFKEKKHLK